MSDLTHVWNDFKKLQVRDLGFVLGPPLGCVGFAVAFLACLTLLPSVWGSFLMFILLLLGLGCTGFATFAAGAIAFEEIRSYVSDLEYRRRQEEALSRHMQTPPPSPPEDWNKPESDEPKAAA